MAIFLDGLLRLYIGRLLALRALLHVNADLVFLQLLTFCLNLGEVRKQVLATVVRRNKSKAFHIVEPFTVPVGIWLRSSQTHCWHNATIVRCAFKIYDGWYCQEPRGFRQFRPYPVRHPPRLSGQYWAYRYPEK
jgi:hypothetical protein